MRLLAERFSQCAPFHRALLNDLGGGVRRVWGQTALLLSMTAMLVLALYPQMGTAQSLDLEWSPAPASVEAQVLQMIEEGTNEHVPADLRRALERRLDEANPWGAGLLDRAVGPSGESAASRAPRSAGTALTSRGSEAWGGRSGTLNGVVLENNFSFVFDIVVKDGVLYVGGGGISFTGNGHRINNIARFDGSQWEVLGSGLLNTSDRGEFLGQTLPAVETIAVADDGTVYAGGHFTETGDSKSLNHVAKFDGSEWVQVGTGLLNPDGTRTATIEVLRFDEGGTLHAVGRFSESGDGRTLNHVARFDGSAWQPIGEGFGSRALSMAFDANGMLYVGGRYTQRGDGQDLLGIARFDGEWTQVGTGLEGGVSDLAFGSDGVLYAGGGFEQRGDGTTIGRVGRFENDEWTEVGNGLNDTVAWVTLDDSDQLYATGDFTTQGDSSSEVTRVARFDGNAWQQVGNGLGNSEQEVGPTGSVLAFDEDGTLYAGGSFDQRSDGTGPPLNHLATFTDGQWIPAVNTVSAGGINGSINDVVSHDGDLYIGGDFSHVGPQRVNGIARWGGSTWHPVGSGLTGWSSLRRPVQALAVSDNGTLYAGGGFSERGDGSQTLNRVAKFNGSSWVSLGSGLGDPSSFFSSVQSLVVGNEGTLYAGGRFTANGSGEDVNYVAQFENGNWLPVSGGVSSYVYALTLDGGDLLAGGEFSATADGSTDLSRAARFDGADWSQIGSGLGESLKDVRSLAVDEGSVYAAGPTAQVGDGDIKRVAQWEEGQDWQQIGAGLGNPDDEFAEVRVQALSVKNEVLFAGGEFVERGDGTPLSHVARFVGGAWRPLGSGTRDDVAALHASEDMVVGGQFVQAGRVFTPRLAAHPVSLSSVASKTVDSEGPVQFGDTGGTIHFSGVSGSGTVEFRKFSAGPSGSDGISESNVSDYRFTIDAQGDLTFDSETEVRLAVGTLGGISDADNVTFYRRSTPGMGTFDDLSTSHDSEADELVAATGSFGELVLASDSEPLPVALAGVDPMVDGDAVHLSWSTASETGNAEFQIQRCRGGRENGGEGAWAQVGRVDGSGTTTEPRSYEFTDAKLPYEADRLTYRLKQVDTDGSAHFSDPVTVERSVDEVELLGTYPNPASQRATARYALPEQQDVSLRLYDALGRQVRTVAEGRQEGRHEQRLDLSSLSSGMYFLRLSAAGQVRTQKLTVVR